jgi:hypothetical protein
MRAGSASVACRRVLLVVRDRYRNRVHIDELMTASDSMYKLLVNRAEELEAAGDASGEEELESLYEVIEAYEAKRWQLKPRRDERSMSG